MSRRAVASAAATHRPLRAPESCALMAANEINQWITSRLSEGSGMDLADMIRVVFDGRFAAQLQSVVCAVLRSGLKRMCLTVL